MGNQESVTNVDLVIYALGVLGGASSLVHTERIAAFCYRIAPSQFSWVLEEFRNSGWPDKYVAKTALEDAKKKEYGALVSGRYQRDLSKDGWRLTAKGAEWFVEHQKRLSLRLGEEPSRPGIAEQRILKQLREHRLFAAYKKSGIVGSGEFFQFLDLLNCSPDARNDVIQTKLDRLLAVSDLAGDSEMKRFLLQCSSVFLQEG